MATLPTLAMGTYTNVSLTSIVGSDPVLETIGTASDTDYVQTQQNATGRYTAEFTLDNMPSDFGTMTTLSIQLRFLQSGLSNNTWDTLAARVYESGGTTPLTDEATVSSSITATSATNSTVIGFTGVNTSQKSAVWNGAVVRIYFDITKNKGGDTFSAQVTAGELTGTYETSITRSYGIIVE